MTDMGPKPIAAALTRLTAARYAPAVGAGLLGLAAAGQAIARAATKIGPGGSVVTYAALLCLLALTGTVPLAVLRPVPAAVTVTTASVALFALGVLPAAVAVAQVIAVYRLGATDAPWPGTRVTQGARGSRGLRPAEASRAGTQFLAVALAVPFLVLALTSGGSVPAVLLASLVPAAAGTGIAARARRADRTQTAVAGEIADALTENLARGERARIARELHDVVAHHISMIAVQTETARLTTPGLPDAGARRFAEIGDTARAGLTEMRRLLGVLREDAEATVADRHPQPGLPQLTELIDAARAASAASTRLIVSGPVAEFDPGVELAAYRIVQEALTNARRHAPGAAVDVELRYDDDALHVRIRDNGPGPGRSSAEGGHGLLGMRERAATVGGSLRTGAAPGGGFCVEAALPAKPEVS
jgi:signal transduction histidine kinase